MPPRRRSPEKRGLSRDAIELHRAMTAMLRAYAYRDRDRMGYHGLSITQNYVMEALERRGPLTLMDLVDEMGLDKSTVSRAVAIMETRGFLRRKPNAADGRSVLLAPTPRGTARRAMVIRDLVAENQRLLAPFAAQTRRDFVRIVDALTAAVTSRRLEETD